ncbi:MAG: tetratricopeptide repeat protein [Candidatus Hydrogenedentes bacterium]|nr:tetratricopeptide repeat protein [Candidatus Hydrogenedentota bacterium]
MSSTENKAHRKTLSWIFLIIILIVGLSLRIAYLHEISKEPWFQCPLYDPLYNHYWAKGIATGDWDLPATVNDPEIRYTPHGRPPGYPYILAVTYFVFGVNPITPRIIQYILGLINILLIWWILHKYLKNRVIAILGTFVFATYWGNIYFESLLSYPVYVIFFILIWLILLLKWREKSYDILYLSFSGIVLGIIILFRPNAILLVSLYYILLAKEKTAKKIKKIIATSFLLLCCISLPLIPSFIRNYIVAQDFVFVSSYGGLNFYVGNHPDSNGAEPRIPELQRWIGTTEWSCFDYPSIVRGLAKDLGKDYISFSEANRFFYRKSISNIVSNPKSWLKLTLKKVLLFWGPIEITNDTVPELDRENSKILSKLPKFSIFSSIFFASIVYILFSVILKRNFSAQLPFIVSLSVLVTITYFLSVLPFFVAGRYRMPIIPFILIVDLWFISELWRNLSEKRISSITIQSALLIVSALITNINFTGYQPSKSVWHFRQGTSALLCQNYNRAVEEFKMSLKYDPENIFAKINYAIATEKIGRPTEAIFILTDNFQRKLNTSEELNALGYLFERIGDISKAQKYYANAIVNNFHYTLAHSNIARIFALKHDYIDARRHLEIVVSHQPYNFYAHFQLAKLYESLSDYNSAIKHYKICLKINPTSEVCWNNIGWIYAELGNYTSALTAYIESIRLNPNYSLAYINLANLHIKMGNPQKAETTLKNLLSRETYNCEALVLLSNLYLFKGDLVKSYLTLTNALPFCGEHPKVLNNLGTILWRYYENPDALVMWLNSIAIDPKIIEAYTNLADFYEFYGDCKTAIEYLLLGLIKSNDISFQSILNGFLCYE